MILMRHSKLEEDKGFSKVKGLYIVFRMYACEVGSLTNIRCPYRCLLAVFLLDIQYHSIISDLQGMIVMLSKKHLAIKLTVLSIDTYLLLKMKWGV